MEDEDEEYDDEDDFDKEDTAVCVFLLDKVIS